MAKGKSLVPVEAGLPEAMRRFRLSSGELYHASELERFGFESTADLEPLSTTIGQNRAMDAINFAVEMKHGSFNLYVMGSSGLGRHELVGDALREHAGNASRPVDWCYVFNYQNSNEPHMLQVAPGIGRSLRADMQQLVEDLLTVIPAAFDGEDYKQRYQEIINEIKEIENKEADALDEIAQRDHIVLMHGPSGFTLTPEKDGKKLTSDEFDALPEAEQEQFRQSLAALKQRVKEAMEKAPEWQHELQNRIRQIDRETMSLTVSQYLKRLEGKYNKYKQILKYLAELKADIIENLDWFRKVDASGEQVLTSDEPVFNRYKVNVLVDNAESHGAPIIVEDNPTYQNLIGRIEHVAHMGTLQTDFTLIKPGALHKAIGGYLVLDAEKVLSNPFAWDGLKRVLRSGEIRIESVERQLSLVSTISLDPQPIPIDLKVVLIGGRQLYYLLKEYDPEFALLFKVSADFSEEFPRENDNELLFARLIATLQHREGLREIARDGVARIIEESARRSWDNTKLSLHMGSLLELLREADFQAKKQDSIMVRREDVQAAIDAQRLRSNQWQEKLQEEMVDGVLRIETEGRQLAQVNGLSVLSMGDYAFGAPTKITATARLGSGEVIDIEREAEQGGNIHSKGVLILSSYLAERYAKHQPLSLSASLVFEQTYSHVEGDSASAAELCALLSAIADVPIKQSLAITGSINQHGQIQAIGGVCEKIEGFFDLCVKRGLTGDQGVIIPQSNVRHLMLNKQVVDAVNAGDFHVFAVDHVDNALELLIDLPAGQADADGVFSRDSINYQVQYRLAEWLALRQHYSSPEPKRD
jgi:lon-related putative ATP-dependent protease